MLVISIPMAIFLGFVLGMITVRCLDPTDAISLGALAILMLILLILPAAEYPVLMPVFFFAAFYGISVYAGDILRRELRSTRER